MTEVEFNDIQLDRLEKFLLFHEEDISDSMVRGSGNFYLLSEIFEVIIGRVPEG